MRYTKDDYNRIISAITGNGRTLARLAPSERRLLNEARTAYVMAADVPLYEVKIVRAILEQVRRDTTDAERARARRYRDNPLTLPLGDK